MPESSYKEEQEPISEPITRQQSTGLETTGYARFRDRDQVRQSITINLENSYEIIDLPSLVNGIEPDKFYDRGYIPVLREMGDLVVSFEGPVREEVVITRIARAHGWQRTGPKIRDRVVKVLGRRYATTKDPNKDKTKFYWPEDVDPEAWDSFRLPITEEHSRSTDDISFIELGVMARKVLSEGATDPAKRMADLMEIKRLSQSARNRLNEVFDRVRSGESLLGSGNSSKRTRNSGQMPENVGASLITEENSPRLTQSYYGDRDIAETEKQIDNLEDGEQAGKSAIKGQLQELRGKIWRETGTEPDKKGILKRSLLEKYLESPVTTQDEWEAMLGHEASIIHESHKKYLPEIFSILSKYKQQI